MRILLAEDDPTLAQFLSKGLREHSYAVDVAADGDAAVYQVAINPYDAIVLDVMLPRRDGFSVCREIRRRGLAVPVSSRPCPYEMTRIPARGSRPARPIRAMARLRILTPFFDWRET